MLLVTSPDEQEEQSGWETAEVIFGTAHVGKYSDGRLFTTSSPSVQVTVIFAAQRWLQST